MGIFMNVVATLFVLLLGVFTFFGLANTTDRDVRAFITTLVVMLVIIAAVWK